MTNTNYEEIVEHHSRMMELAKEYNVRINDEKKDYFYHKINK